MLPSQQFPQIGLTEMEELLVGLRAAAEPTRLRLLALLAEGEMTVSELTLVLGQSSAACVAPPEADVRRAAA